MHRRGYDCGIEAGASPQRRSVSIEHKLAIHKMITRYSYVSDDQDADGFADVFVKTACRPLH